MNTFFITCHFLDKFWKDIFNLLEKVKLGKHILTLKNLIWGYKINDIEYYDINFFLTVIIFSIHKIHYLSEFRTKKINVFSVFKTEFRNRLVLQNNFFNHERKGILGKLFKCI